MEVHGSCDPKFQSVRQEFERNFRERGEVGASVCITLRGETVVDLWGGMARPETQTPWTRDTISIVFSSTKGATALGAHMWRHAENSISMRRSQNTGRSSRSQAKSRYR